MKHLVFLFLIFSLGVAIADGSSTSIGNLAESSGDDHQSKKRIHQVDLSYTHELWTFEFKDSANEDLDLQGIKMALNKDFEINARWVTLTSFYGVYSSAKDVAGKTLKSTSHFSNKKYAIEQRIAYRTYLGETLLRPYAGLSGGFGVIKYRFQPTGKDYEIEDEWSYFSFATAVGLEVVVNEYITPFIRYEYNRGKVQDIQGRAVIDGNSAKVEGNNVTSSFDSHNFFVGVGVRF